jgi:AcrR family transcriptional regulator
MNRDKNYHHGELRAALLEFALVSLDRDGTLPSWRALARACGVSQTAPYRHFANHDALQAALAAACFERLTASILQATRDVREPRGRLAAGLRAYLEFGRKHPSWYALIFERKPPSAAAPSGAAAYHTLIAGVTACGVDDPPTVAFALWCALHGLTALTVRGLTAPVAPARADAAIEAVIAMCLAHVEAHRK